MYSGILGDPGAVSGGAEKSKNRQGNVILFNCKRHAKFQALLQKKRKPPKIVTWHGFALTPSIYLVPRAGLLESRLILTQD